VLAGSTAVDFVSDERTRRATLEQADRFLDASAAAHGPTWTADDLEIAHATGAWLAAHNAAFEVEQRAGHARPRGPARTGECRRE
jgi:hypothetical protein